MSRARTISNLPHFRPSVTDYPYAAMGDGIQDNVAAINDLISKLSAAGGGGIYFPPGTYMVGESSPASSVGIIHKSNVWLIGHSPAATIIKLKDGAESHLVWCTPGLTDAGIVGLTLDGNRTHQTLTVHGVRVAGCDGFTMRDFIIRQTAHYGIGIQAGTNKAVKISHGKMLDTGGDGIDTKNHNDLNEDIVLDSLTIRRWGNDTIETIQAAIDCRGPVRASNIWISEPVADDAVGFRCRTGELLDVNGYGGHRSHLTNFDIRMGAKANAVAVSVPARSVGLAQGYISGGQRGVVVQDSDFSAVNVTVEGASGAGWLLDKFGSGLDADNASLTNCSASGCGAHGFDVETDSAVLTGCNAVGNTGYGIRLTATSSNCRVLGGDVRGNSIAGITDGGTGNRTKDVIGFVSQNSGTATLTSGTSSRVVAHGLNRTPAGKDIVLTPLKSTGSTPLFVDVTTIGSTNFTVKTPSNAAADIDFAWAVEII